MQKETIDRVDRGEYRFWWRDALIVDLRECEKTHEKNHGDLRDDRLCNGVGIGLGGDVSAGS